MTGGASDHEKKSKVEVIKEASVGLRGTIRAELADTSLDHVEDATSKLLKFHGTYQQDNRDLRKARRKEGLGKAFSFMVRNRIPGGKMTAAQFLGELQIADELGNGTIRITTRQSIQLHGVVKNNLWETIHRINEIRLSTQSACGDVTGHEDHLGWHQQADGRWFIGLPIENGRVKDEGKLRLKTAMRTLLSSHVPTVRLTLHQNILLCDLQNTRAGR